MGIRPESVRSEVARELDEELAFHFERTVAELMAAGLSREEAEAEAHRRFGDLTHYRPRLERIDRRRERKRRMVKMMQTMREGLVYALRSVRRSPGFAAAVVLTLALGIGANATMFGIVDRILLRAPDHVKEPDGLRRLYLERSFLGDRRLGEAFTYADFRDFEQASSFTEVAAYSGRELTWSLNGRARRIEGVLATWDFFPLLGVTARIGRFFGRDDDRIDAPLTAVVSHEFWQGALGGDPDVVGRHLELDGREHTVVGVAPSGFTGVNLSPVDVWLPLVATQESSRSNDFWRTGRGFWWLYAVARLAPHATEERAAEEATALHRRGRSEMIDAGRYDPQATIVPASLITARGPKASDETVVARWLTGVSLLVLLIACANVASLLLARITERRRAIAVRLAMGISRTRLVALQVSEALVLAVLGGGAALVIVRWGGVVVRRTLLPQVHWGDGAVGARVVVFALIVSVLAGLLAGVIPALQAREPDLTDALKEGARGGSLRHSRLRSGLSVFQAAFSVVLMVGAGLFVRSLGEVYDLDLGLDADRVVMVRLEMTEEMEPAEERALYRRTAERLRRLGGIEEVATTNVPYRFGMARDIGATGWDSMPALPGGGPYFTHASPEYFRTLGLEVLEGRGFTEEDVGEEAQIAVLAETMARTLWPGERATGKCLYIQGRNGESSPCVRVVGVVEDASRGSLVEDPFLQYYLPLGQHDAIAPAALYARVGEDPDAILPHVREEVRAAAPATRFVEARSLRDILDPQARSWRLGATMFTVFGFLALAVAVMGLYSVLAFDVAQRRPELGVRSALGASRKRLLRMVVGSGLRLVVLGLLVGSGAALVAGRWVEPLLFRVSATDPLVYGVVAGTLLVVGVLASLLPALRATAVDPAGALRAE